MGNVALKFYKTHEAIEIPKFSTTEAACFDIAFQIAGKHSYTGYNAMNKRIERPTPKGEVYVGAGERIMVPTGLKFDIPKGYSVRIHPRSGLSLKSGLILANSEGVIDSDYTDEVFVLIWNISDVGISLRNGDRIAQGELVPVLNYDLVAADDEPKKKGNRKGGMGSTGVNNEQTST